MSHRTGPCDRRTMVTDDHVGRPRTDPGPPIERVVGRSDRLPGGHDGVVHGRGTDLGRAAG